jgi:hypothetical protein
MTMHFLFTSAGATLGAVALFCLGGLGEIELDSSVDCNCYFCQPQTTDVSPRQDYAGRRMDRLALVAPHIKQVSTLSGFHRNRTAGVS